jgi:hypothetical protein
MRKNFWPIAWILLLFAFLKPVYSKSLKQQFLNHARRAAPQDAFPVLHNPEKVSVERANEVLKPNQWVIGIEINGEATAYPVAVMGVHELVNDQVGGHPIAVCW